MKVLLYTLVGGILFSVVAFGQPGNPTNPVPLGFVEILAGAGVLYAAKKKLGKKR